MYAETNLLNNCSRNVGVGGFKTMIQFTEGTEKACGLVENNIFKT
jgi:hypothetical protein